VVAVRLTGTRRGDVVMVVVVAERYIGGWGCGYGNGSWGGGGLGNAGRAVPVVSMRLAHAACSCRNGVLRVGVVVVVVVAIVMRRC